MTSPETSPYDGIIPTGWLTAYGRTFTDLPYTQQIFDALEEIREPNETFRLMQDTQLAPQFEARHRLLNRLVTSTGATQILEVAAGLTTRGLELAEDPSVVYVELDLPAMSADKRKIVDMLARQGSVPKRPNLHFHGGSAVAEEDVSDATRFFDPDKEVVVVNEGLLRYLSMDEKAKFARNVGAVLRKFGGAWITSDISVPKIFYKEKEIMSGRRQKISEITGINIAQNLFTDADDAEQFFNELGFSVERHSFYEVIDELISPQKLNVSREYTEAITKPATAFVMRLMA